MLALFINNYYNLFQIQIRLQQNMDIENQSTNNQIKKSTLQVLSVKSEKLQNEIILATPNSNGFTNGLTILQILPVTYGLMLITQTIILIMNLKNTILIVVTSIIFSIVTVLLVILWFLATKIDPTDQTQLQHRRAIQNRIQFNFANCKYFCQVCHTYVGKESFHCKKCNRCVQMFDHHCKWLNNCIGAKNYLQFFGLICCTQIQLILNLVFNCVNIGLTIFNKEQLTWKFYLQITFIFCDGIILFFNSALFFIHLYLVITKKTTLQLILQKRKANQIHPSKQQKDLQKRNSQQINENISSNLSSSLEEKQLKKLKTSSEMKYNKFQLKNMNTNKSRCKTLVIKTNKLEL